MRAQPMITCSSVAAASRWYQRVLGFDSAHGGDDYEMLTSGGVLVLQLHDVDPDEHPALLHAERPIDGNGVALWFETDDYDADLARIRAAAMSSSADIDVDVVEDDHVNPLANHREIWLRDPDGYVVVVSSPYGHT